MKLSIHFFLLSSWWICKTECDNFVISCNVLETCVLPCAFERGSDVVLHWTKEPHGTLVHIYYHGQDQLQHQGEDFRGRTALSEKIQSGNASLTLKNVQVQDEGRYKCDASTNTSAKSGQSYVNVKVYAPVLQVSVHQEGDLLVCSSQRLYPRPAVLWTPSTEALSTVTVSQTGLFSVNSSVPLTQPPLEYSCNISTAHSWRSATYRRTQDRFASLSKELLVPCTAAKAPVKSLVWKFNNNNILTRTDGRTVYSESWKQFVDGVTESNRLILFNMSSHQLGLYTCVLTTQTETFVIETEFIPGEFEHTLTFPVILGAVIFFAFVFTLAIFFVHRHKKMQYRPSQMDSDGRRQRIQFSVLNKNADTGETSLTWSQGSQTRLCLTSHHEGEEKSEYLTK